ncbi:D-aminoacyl-tRNA deacylase [Fructilactobacillus florum]|uniref:D-aminoacyl-tRNA deacylase n=1 Tax=Fructilactobacillus florum TaxID=640331 RepID=UPI00028DC950|nr:D-aminoacyl-tRNA deacylase [Fructilactobacillus florum]EKK20203.1 D-tyrosyl-tRNA(Tyr) deacylase [Fructilactobacillus florum 2F]
MKLVIQRVKSAQVKVSGQLVNKIGAGSLIFVGVAAHDQLTSAVQLAAKVCKLRMFSDPAGKMNLNLFQVGGQILSISQFTLLADLRRGNRPSFQDAGDPEHAQSLYHEFNQQLISHGADVKTGIFGADMLISLENDGPVTFEMEA